MQALAIAALVAVPVWQLWKMNQERAAAEQETRQ